MPLSRRYTPELAPGEVSVFGMDFSYVIPPGVGIATGSLTIRRVSGTADTAVSAGPVSVHERTLYATLTAGAAADGHDYLLVWIATDTEGNHWPRAAMVLCAVTS
jgi:hypothetical protein